VGAPASQLRLSKWALIAGAARTKELHNLIFYCNIHVLLVNTNTVIYNMLYNYVAKVTCVLAVGGDELGVGDDDDALSEGLRKGLST